MKKRHHKHTYNPKYKKNKKRKIFYPDAVEFRQKPFLQAGGMPACALPYPLWCVVNSLGISSI